MMDAGSALGGFVFSQRPSGRLGPDGGDGFCVRDTLWKLFRWPTSGPEWDSFPDWPSGQETAQLVDHLGLAVYRLTGDQAVMDELSAQHHPGIAVFEFPTLRLTHVEYAYSVAVITGYWDREGKPTGDVTALGPEYGWPLPWPRRKYPVRLASVIVDEGQAPHPPTPPYF